MDNIANKAPWQLLGEEFVKQYYQVFDTNREQLVALYAVRVPYFAVCLKTARRRRTQQDAARSRRPNKKGIRHNDSNSQRM